MKKKMMLTMLMAAVAMLNTACPPKSPTEPTGDTISFSSAAATATSNYVKMEQVSVSGDTVTIAVKAVNIAEPVGGLAVYVTYDSSHLKYVTASNGDVITGEKAKIFTADNPGEIVVSISDVPDASPDSNGTLFTITFKGIATGNGSIGISSTTSGLFNAAGDSGGITVSGWYGGTATVQ